MSDADDEIRATIAAFTAEIVALVHQIARAELESARAAAPEPVPAATLDRVAGFVRDHAAYTASEIAAGLATPQDEVSAALAELVRARRVRKSGARAQTRYFAL